MNSETVARQQFLEDYRRIRHAEGRGSQNSDYYLALPFQDLSRRNRDMWAMRAKTFSYFARRVLRSIEKQKARPLDILDLGAGNCWLSYRLSLRGHRPVAVDIFADPLDGLRAARHYPIPFPTIEADFASLPVPAASFDMAIFNASLHYATDYQSTLTEVKRCLRPSGSIVILDSPIYQKREHGLLMAEEKHSEFQMRYGFRSDALPSLEFLDLPVLAALGSSLPIKWRIQKPWYGWQWHLRPLKALLQRRRPPSRFWVVTGTAALR